MRPRAGAAAPVIALLALMVGMGCGRSEPEVPVIQAATAERVVVDGEARPRSVVTVRFNREFELVSERLPLASYFELLVPNLAGDDEERVLVQSATRRRDDGRFVVLRMDRLIPEGTRLLMSRSAFRSADEGALEIEVESDIAVTQAYMATTRFRLTNPAMFPDPPRVPPVVEADRDADAQRAALEGHLAARGAGDAVTQAALARFDAMPPEIIPSPKLRAALAALTGTFADSAAGYLVTDANCTGAPVLLVAFQEPPQFPDLLARVSHDEEGRRTVSLHPRLEGERIEHLMPILAHEAIHCDLEDGRFEEVAATAFDSLLYVQLLTWFPDLPLAGTALARDLNIDALAMLNSGMRYPESGGILPSAEMGPVLPGSTAPYLSFADVVAAAYPGVLVNASPAEPLALAYAAVLAEAVGIPAEDPFNLAYLDVLVARVFTPETIAALIEALELEGMGPG